MLRLLPKNVINYIYELVHKNNTRDIVNEYKCSSRTVEFGQSLWYIIYIRRKRIDFNYRDMNPLRTYQFHIYRFGVKRAKLPERYRYSLTRQEFESMSNKMKKIPD